MTRTEELYTAFERKLTEYEDMILLQDREGVEQAKDDLLSLFITALKDGIAKERGTK